MSMVEESGEGKIKFKVPQYPQAEPFKGILYKMEALTGPSKMKIAGESPVEIEKRMERTLALRAARAKLYHEVKKTNQEPDLEKRREERKSIITEAHQRDELAYRFLADQKEVAVDMEGLGEQKSKFVALNPPEGRAIENLPPIVLIPGISSDLETCGMLPQELAFSGRKVITIAYPESWHGKVTYAFGEAAERSKNLEPHTTYFKKAIDAIVGQDHFELWGHSTGSVIASEILADEKYQKSVSDAVLLCPPCAVDQKYIQTKGGGLLLSDGVVVETMLIFLKRFKEFPYLNTTSFEEIEYTKDFRENQLKTHLALRKKVLHRYPWWEQEMKVFEKGRIIVVSADKDRVAKSYKAVKEMRCNPALKVLEIKGMHLTPLMEPAKVIQAIGETFSSSDK